MDWIQLGSFQTAFAKDSHPLQGAFSILTAAGRAREWDIPLLAAQIEFKKALELGEQKPSAESNERTWSREAAVGVDLATVGTTQFRNEARATSRQEDSKRRRRVPKGARESPIVLTILVDTVPSALDQQWWTKKGPSTASPPKSACVGAGIGVCRLPSTQRCSDLRARFEKCWTKTS